jgi:pimeloyl-ACP methyl ester carboxylesterase
MPYGAKSRSDRLDTQDRDEYADFLHSLLHHLDISSPVLIGASISGEVTLRYLIRGHPARAGVVIGPVGLKNLGPQLSKIAVPLLAIWGDIDPVSSPSDSHILKGEVKTATIRMIERAGHPCYLDEPAKFTGITEDFLQKIS